jgi:LytS/YehU family sensor histidine kinase
MAVYVANNMFRFYKPRSGERFQRLIWGLALTFLAVYALQFLLQQIFQKEAAYLAFLHNSLPIRYVFFLLSIAALQISRWVVQHDQEQQEKKLRESEYTGLAKEAELSKLRLQLQPHFLFNSLNSINALVGSKPNEARKMIQQLSDFLRGTIRHEDRSLIPFQEELVHLNLYLEIEKVRFGNRLQTEVVCNEEANKLLIPALLLQPVVENAIKFGLYDTIDAITIRIDAEVKNNTLVVKVENPFDPDTQPTQKGTGFGLSSVQRRLYLLFAQNDLLITRKDKNIFTTLIIIPQS